MELEPDFIKTTWLKVNKIKASLRTPKASPVLFALLRVLPGPLAPGKTHFLLEEGELDSAVVAPTVHPGSRAGVAGSAELKSRPPGSQPLGPSPSPAPAPYAHSSRSSTASDREISPCQPGRRAEPHGSRSSFRNRPHPERPSSLTRTRHFPEG